jgi:hypothetical protein
MLRMMKDDKQKKMGMWIRNDKMATINNKGVKKGC